MTLKLWMNTEQSVVGLPLWSNLLWHIINKPRVVAQLWPNVFLDEFFPGFNAYDSFKRSNNICVRKTLQVSSHQGIRTYSREISRSWIIGTRKKDVVLHLHEYVIPTPSPFNHCLSASTVNRRGPNTQREGEQNDSSIPFQPKIPSGGCCPLFLPSLAIFHLAGRMLAIGAGRMEEEC